MINFFLCYILAASVAANIIYDYIKLLSPEASQFQILRIALTRGLLWPLAPWVVKFGVKGSEKQ